jgi:hypothetical protein
VKTSALLFEQSKVNAASNGRPARYAGMNTVRPPDPVTGHGRILHASVTKPADPPGTVGDPWTPSRSSPG